MKTTSQFSKIGSDCQVLKIFFYEVIFWLINTKIVKDGCFYQFSRQTVFR